MTVVSWQPEESLKLGSYYYIKTIQYVIRLLKLFSLISLFCVLLTYCRDSCINRTWNNFFGKGDVEIIPKMCIICN